MFNGKQLEQILEKIGHLNRHLHEIEEKVESLTQLVQRMNDAQIIDSLTKRLRSVRYDLKEAIDTVKEQKV